jgi:hypothetical protein
VPFEAHIVKPAYTSPKTFQINLYKGKVYQFDEQMRKKAYMCTDIVQITRGGDTLTLDIRPSISIASKRKRLHFELASDAQRFQAFIEYRNDYGACVRAAFDGVDAKGSRYITRATLVAALEAEDLQPTEQDLLRMLRIAKQDDAGRVNFLDFFHFFLGTPVYTVRSCLQEWLQRARHQSGDGVQRRPDSTTLSLLSGSGVRLLQGELIASVELNIRWMIGSGWGRQEASTSTAGAVLVTNFRVCLISSRCLFSDCTAGQAASAGAREHSRHDRPLCFDVIQVPLNCLHKAYLVSVGIGQSRRELMLATKDLRIIRISFPLSDHSLSKEESLHQLIQKMAFPGSSQGLFAYAYFSAAPPPSPSPPAADPWRAADMTAEYRRQGLCGLPSQWKIFDNSDYSLCDTYPAFLAVAAGQDEAELREASTFRSQRRLPCVTYRHPHSGAVLTRSAQPLVGIRGKSSRTDQQLLHLYRLHGRAVDLKYVYPACLYVCVCLCLCVCIYMCICVSVCLCLCVCMSVCMHVCVCMSVCVYVCLPVCVSVCVCVCILSVLLCSSIVYGSCILIYIYIYI